MRLHRSGSDLVYDPEDAIFAPLQQVASNGLCASADERFTVSVA
jgi:hypothetical protein